MAKTFKTNKQMDKNAAKLEGERVLEQIADMRKKQARECQDDLEIVKVGNFGLKSQIYFNIL